jgi:hypothetical protein
MKGPDGGLERCFSGGVVGFLIVLHAPSILAAKTCLAELPDRSVIEALRKELHRDTFVAFSTTMLLR